MDTTSRASCSDAVIYNKWTHDLYQGRRRFMNIQREYIEPIGLSIRHFEDGPFLQVVAMPFQTPDETAMVSYKKSSEHWDTFTSKPVALGHIDRGFFDKYLEKCIKHFLLRYEKHPVIEQLLRQKEQLCVKATYLFGMLGLLMRGWYEDCVPAPEVLASQMDSLLEFKIATLETALLNKLQDNLSLNNTMSNSLVMLAILVLLERDLWRLMHWALYGNNAPDWKHPTRAPDLMRATLQQAQAILGLFHSVGQWPFDTSSFHRPVRYDPLDSTSLDNSLLCEAFDVKKTPEKAGEVIASLTYDNFIQSYSPTVDEQSSDLGGQYIELSSNIKNSNSYPADESSWPFASPHLNFFLILSQHHKMGLTFMDEPEELRLYLENLNKTPRRGWLKSGVPGDQCETVAQHTYRMLEIVEDSASSRPDVDLNRALHIAKFHDCAEAVTGDHIPGEMTSEQKRAEEDEAYAMFCSLDPKRGQVIRESCIEYREDSTLTARLVKDADKFQRLEQANIYRKMYPHLNFDRFQSDANLIRDPELKKKADGILKEWRSQAVKCVLVIGAPGVGKGTQCARALQSNMNMRHVSAGELLRSAKDDDKSPHHKEAERVLQGTTPASPELITALIYEAVTSRDYRVALLDGFPYDSAQWEGYKKIFPNISGVIHLVASPSVCKSRLLGRAKDSQRDDDVEVKMEKRLEGYKNRGEAIALQLKGESQNAYYEIDAERDEEDVASDFQKYLDCILLNAAPATRAIVES
ncbi:uncharacterized protein FIESC28_10406 [Fusarium coffeatum]|uniref:HD domain-containing protein n=1 Tax=Fusarium coffeatum TaxID=231269 RepID=A0A366QSY1_9HYPO|nr:uncharacterized protein FIESC28_10406 [Fusarium coffeatum]RBR08024.1 hypothetical protein FIESC28_10406 [Fusarium coffeatum]